MTEFEQMGPRHRKLTQADTHKKIKPLSSPSIHGIMKIETYICTLRGGKWITGLNRKHELFSFLLRTTGLVLTCKSCTDSCVNYKVVMACHLTFPQISLSKASEQSTAALGI